MLALLLIATVPAMAMALYGVAIPDSVDAAGTRLFLNGAGLRTFSFLHVRVYVAGLYLVHPNTDADAILQSADPKLLNFEFLRDVDADRAQASWRESLIRACKDTCGVPISDIDAFVAHVPAVHRGDVSTLLFTANALDISLNHHLMGHINNARFSHLVLLSFLGPTAASPELRFALLGLAQ